MINLQISIKENMVFSRTKMFTLGVDIHFKSVVFHTALQLVMLYLEINLIKNKPLTFMICQTKKYLTYS